MSKPETATQADQHLLKGLKPVTIEDVRKLKFPDDEHKQAAFFLLHQIHHDKPDFLPAMLAAYPEMIAILGEAKFYPPVRK